MIAFISHLEWLDYFFFIDYNSVYNLQIVYKHRTLTLGLNLYLIFKSINYLYNIPSNTIRVGVAQSIDNAPKWGHKLEKKNWKKLHIFRELNWMLRMADCSIIYMNILVMSIKLQLTVQEIDLQN